MDDFDRLLALTRAAESCNALARDFIDHFGDDPEFSRFLSAPGQPYCEPAATSQATQHMDHAWSSAEHLQKAIQEWNKAGDALYYVGAAVGIRLPVLEINGATYQTAHEAARYSAAAMIEVLHAVEGDGEIEHCFDLARRLGAFRPAPDFYGRIHGESHAAAELIDLKAPEETDAEVEAKRTKWKAVRALLDNEPDADKWDLETRRRKASEWNGLYSQTEGWQMLNNLNLAQILRDRRKTRRKNGELSRGTHRAGNNICFPRKISALSLPTLGESQGGKQGGK